MKSSRPIIILLAFAVILSASALAARAPYSPFEPEEEALSESLISGPPLGEPTETMPAVGSPRS